MWPFSRRPRIRRVSDRFSVTGQLRPDDLPAIAAAGFDILICARPDGEGRNQTSGAEIAAQAARLGLAVRHIPVAGPPGPEQIVAFRAAMAESQGRVLGWCRSGARVRMLHHLARD